MSRPDQHLIHDRDTVKNFYYKDTLGLKIRLKTWARFGTNKKPFTEWVGDVIRMPKQKQSTFLDAGCGTGEFMRTMRLANKNCIGYGFDLSEAMIALSKKNNQAWTNNIQLGDVEKIPFPKNKFDRVLAVYVLHHVPNIKRALQELYRVMAPGGTLTIITADSELNRGLNKIHYASLRALRFPRFMLATKGYLRFSSEAAESILQSLKQPIKKTTYKNSLIFKKELPVIRYYRSAMMYRNTHGPYDGRISLKQWKELLDYVKEKIRQEIQKTGSFMIPGNVVAFTIKKKRAL